MRLWFCYYGFRRMESLQTRCIECAVDRRRSIEGEGLLLHFSEQNDRRRWTETRIHSRQSEEYISFSQCESVHVPRRRLNRLLHHRQSKRYFALRARISTGSSHYSHLTLAGIFTFIHFHSLTRFHSTFHCCLSLNHSWAGDFSRKER